MDKREAVELTKSVNALNKSLKEMSSVLKSYNENFVAFARIMKDRMETQE